MSGIELDRFTVPRSTLASSEVAGGEGMLLYSISMSFAILDLSVLSDTYAVSRLPPSEPVPSWALHGDFFTISKTLDELSVVCLESQVPGRIRSEKGWRCLRVKGPLDFGLTGILASLANPLAQSGISIFAISTFDTDYLMIRQERFQDALSVLERCGHRVHH